MTLLTDDTMGGGASFLLDALKRYRMEITKHQVFFKTGEKVFQGFDPRLGEYVQTIAVGRTEYHRGSLQSCEECAARGISHLATNRATSFGMTLLTVLGIVLLITMSA